MEEIIVGRDSKEETKILQELAFVNGSEILLHQKNRSKFMGYTIRENKIVPVFNK